MAEWSARWTPSQVVLGLSPDLTTSWICFTVAQSSNPRPVGILNNVMFNLNYLFQLFARPH